MFHYAGLTGNADRDPHEENAGPGGVRVADPFYIDPAERAESQRFLKEQERLQELQRQKLAAAAKTNQPVTVLIADSSDLEAIHAQVDALDQSRQLSFGDDVPSSDNWETLSAAMRDSAADGEAEQQAQPGQQQAQQYEECDLSGRFSVSTFGSASSRSTFYRDT